eukprot:TRINITY_DN7365_c0_g2_i3.p1 TRINITY_DN7365_c0_g2~~TRINITY_DN7365_c0_g2_i3.p1  ORF type:complete len:335 (+),score=58.95 TRINITY_DN7365_c0_g2_i3:67-1071(+)
MQRVVLQLSSQPAVMAINTAQWRPAILQKYAKNGIPAYQFSQPHLNPKVFKDGKRTLRFIGALTFAGIDGKKLQDIYVNPRAFSGPPGTPGQVKWHPGAKQHRARGLWLAYFMLKQLETGVGLAKTMLQESPSYPVTSPKKDWYNTVHQDWRQFVIANLSWAGCKADYTYPATPTFLCQNHTECVTEYEPRRGHSISEINSAGNWTRRISPGDAGPYHSNIKAGSGAEDNKMALCGYRRDGWAEFNLHHVKDGLLFICEPSYGWSRPRGVGVISEEASFMSDGKPVKVRKPTNSFANGMACAEVVRKLPSGGGTLSIRANSNERMICLSFMMWT